MPAYSSVPCRAFSSFIATWSSWSIVPSTALSCWANFPKGTVYRTDCICLFCCWRSFSICAGLVSVSDFLGFLSLLICVWVGSGFNAYVWGLWGFGKYLFWWQFCLLLWAFEYLWKLDHRFRLPQSPFFSDGRCSRFSSLNKSSFKDFILSWCD